MAPRIADSRTLILLAKYNLMKIVCDSFDINVPTAVKVEVASPMSLHQGEKDVLLSAIELYGSLLARDDGKAK